MNTHLMLTFLALVLVTASGMFFASSADATPPPTVNPMKVEPLEFASPGGVEFHGGFWGDRARLIHEITIPHAFEQSELTGRISNFEKAGGLADGEHQGFFFNDSDVYKIVEGAAYSLMLTPDPELESYLDDLIAKIAAAQEDDGYLNTYYTLAEPENKWTDIRVRHELYCAGHLFEAAAAHHEATGKRNLLDIALKLADHIDSKFGPDANRHPPGHEEIEVGLVRLYETSGDKRYLDLAKFFIDERGNAEGHDLYGEYSQDHRPVTEQEEAVGHAVRACYLYMGITDVFEHTRHEPYLDAVDRIWDNVVSKKLYITGSVGASRAGEAFSENYELENKSAYAETCASIAYGMWNARMFRLHHDAKYIDLLERVIYNGFLSGLSLDGDEFFYPNPLACDGHTPFNHGSAERSEWFGCACCPPNIIRFIPSMAKYAYAHNGDTDVFVNLYSPSGASFDLEAGALRIRQHTNYPWDGNIKLTIEEGTALDTPVGLQLRIPGWALGRPMPSDLYRYVWSSDDGTRDAVSLKINGQRVRLATARGFVRLYHQWEPGDEIEMHLPMPIRRVASHEAVDANAGRTALERGPIVYCIEGADFPDGKVESVVLGNDVPLEATFESDLLGGVVAITGGAVRIDRDEEGHLMESPVPFRAIPYYAWNNRGANEMEVWIAHDPEYVPEPLMPTIASGAAPSASHCWSSDTVHALNDQEEPESSHNQDIPRHTWWPRRGTTEWVQYEFDEPVNVSRTRVYWFDDTGIGHCRIPASWRVLYRDATGGAWQPVQAHGEYESAVDQWCEIEFVTVNASALRIEAQLRPEFSGGVLEWIVE